ncbi:MAG: tetratricopeptide repeat protein [Geobacter sp.]|nr:tetratricopeptide repeat protein [Geobacter sp.]
MHIKKRHIPEALEEAVLLFQQGVLQQAGAVLTGILKADPRQAEALHLLGLLALKQGKPAEAESWLVRAVKLAPQVAEFHNSLGVALRKQDKLGEAERSYRRCLKLTPDHIEALDNLGTLLRHRNMPEEAEQYCRRAVALQSDNAKMLANLAGALYEQGLAKESKQFFEQALSKEADKGTLKVIVAGLIDIACATGEMEECRKLHLLGFDKIHPFHEVCAYLMRLNYLSTVDSATLFKEHSRRISALIPYYPPNRMRSVDRAEMSKKLKIGYLSPDLVDHPVGWLLEPIISLSDRERFTTILYDVHMRDYPPKDGLRRACDVWRDCRCLSNEQLTELIIQDDLDILIDLAGHTGGNRFPVLIGRLAPLQVSWLGYFNTTGLPTMDWLLADPFSVLPDEEQYYTERIWRLPHYRFAVQPKEIKAELPSDSPKDPGHRFVFVSCNNLAKITLQVLEVWAAILQQLPEAILLVRWKTLVTDGAKAIFSERFIAAGGSSAQLRIESPLVHEQLLASYHETDLMLDTFPFSGGVTSLDALFAGVPVVTMAGDRMAGRQTQAFLELSGHPELVAHSIDEYIAIAVDLAKDSERIAQLRTTLRDDLLRSPLCDVKQFTKDLEAAYRAMWEGRCHNVDTAAVSTM